MLHKYSYIFLISSCVSLGAFAAKNPTANTLVKAGDSEGKKVFKQNCVACHGQKGEGIVGPNLTDDYWLHGNKLSDVVKVITNGVPAKGMMAWKPQLSTAQIQAVASYVLSLKGAVPANGKAPQGKHYASMVKATPVIASKAKTTSKVTKVADATPAIVAVKVDTAKAVVAVQVATPEVAETSVVTISTEDDNIGKSMALTGNVSSGQRLFNAMLGCSHCHGTNSVGHSDNRNLREIKKRKGDVAPTFNEVFRNGRTGTAMPSWAHLSPKQVADIRSFIVSIQED